MPVLTLHTTPTEVEYQAEIQAAMRLVADAYERALESLLPGHPRWEWMQTQVRAARTCAGLAAVEVAR
jgi:hypothetical protein